MTRIHKPSARKSPPGASSAVTKRLENTLRLYRIATPLLAILALAAILLCLYLYAENYMEETGLFSNDSEIPHRDEVAKITKPLKFSFLPTLMRPNVRITLDFETQTWTLHNIRDFDGQGRLLLEHGRYGRCGELAYHVYQEIAPLLEEKYTIELWRCAESKFFPFMIGDHVVVRMTDKALLASNVCIIDPSYKKYGRLEDFDDYIFIKPSDLRPFLGKNTDETLKVGTTTPILLTKRYLLSLGVVRVNSTFDSQNFGLAIILSKPHRYISRALAEIRKSSGETETGDASSLPMAVKTKEFTMLRARLLAFFEQITGESLPEEVKKIRTLTQTLPAKK
jgi:hypothetical protein